MTEELLISHEKEIQHMQEYFRQNKDMLLKVASRELLWKEFLNLEVWYENDTLVSLIPVVVGSP